MITFSLITSLMALMCRILGHNWKEYFHDPEKETGWIECTRCGKKEVYDPND